MGRNAPLHAAKVSLAMQALQSGLATSKGQAGALAGLGQEALQPHNLVPLVARSRDLGKLPSSGSMLEFGAEVEGRGVVTLRQALTDTAKSVVRTIATLGRKELGELTKAERDTVKLAQSLLGMCKECGLWSEQGQSTMPAEVQAMLARDADRMSVESITAVEVTKWNRHHGRQDGISPTALKQHHQMLTVQTVEEDGIPPHVGETEEL